MNDHHGHHEIYILTNMVLHYFDRQWHFAVVTGPKEKKNDMKDKKKERKKVEKKKQN